MMKGMCGRFERFEGQPVKVFTDDGRIHRGIVAEIFENVLRIVRMGGCVEDIAICHIDAIQEPQMALMRCEGRRKHRNERELFEGDEECCGRSRCCDDGCRCDD